MTKTAVIPMAKTYVSYWSVGEALREFWANAKDGAHNEEGAFGLEYSAETQELVIWNKADAKLETSMLVLGLTSKSKTSKNVGQFGEGAKVGFCRLAAADIGISCENMDEHWDIYFKHNVGYNAEILHVDINQRKKPTSVIKFTFKGVTEDHMESFNRFRIDHAIKEAENLSPRAAEFIDSKIGRIYPFAGSAVFVSGIKIKNASLIWCADLKPELVSLTRDRDSMDWNEKSNINLIMAEEMANHFDEASMSEYTQSLMLEQLVKRIVEADDKEKESLDAQKNAVLTMTRKTRKRIKEALAEGKKLVTCDRDREQAKTVGRETIEVSYDHVKAIEAIDPDLVAESNFWSCSEVDPTEVIGRLNRKWEKLQKVLDDAGIDTEEVEDMRTQLQLTTVLSAKNWYVN